MTDIIVKIEEKDVNLTDLSRRMTEDTDLMLYLQSLLDGCDIIDVDNPNRQYVLLGRRKVLQDLININNITKARQLKNQRGNKK